MIKIPISKPRLIIGAILTVLVVATLVIRGLPLLLLGDGDVMNLVAMDDPIYNLRLVEWMINSGHWYSWFPTFDAMTFYPYGQVMPWGPVFTWITMLVPLAAGASTQQEIVYAALWVPPVLAAVMVPLVYLLGKAVWNWKTGLAAAVFMAFIGGQFFSRSLAGYLDHHVAEVVFGTAFALLYMYAIKEARNEKQEIDPAYVQMCKNRETSPLYWGFWKTRSTPCKTNLKPYLLAALAGFAYVIGFLNMPTMVMFAVIALITTTVLFIWEYSSGRIAWSVGSINCIVFGIAMVASYIYAYVPAEYGLTGYTVFHTIVYFGIVTWSVLLAVGGDYLMKQQQTVPQYVGAMVGLVVAGLVAMAIAVPDQFMPFMNGIMSFFGFNQVMTTIQEARPWTFSEAWAVYNFGFVLMIGGFLVLMLRTWKDRIAENVFVLVWSAFIIVATFRQVRYEYYLAVNVALLAGVCVVYFLQRAWPAFLTIQLQKGSGNK